uniref:Uncharacterized protein n=1 Tax=Panagrolaimus superbus TaxID=310955 RepID=A0A914Z287_9BILA
MGLSKIFNSCIFCYFLIIAEILSEPIENDSDEYFGVPLGALHYSAAGTAAEVYAADEYTIVFNHFTHRPQKLGCTSMMIGPPRSEDTEDVVPGHGILIGIAQPLMTMRSRRAKRQFGLWKSNINLPRQFDHLFMEPNNGTAKLVSNEKRAFSGIHIQHENKETKDITIAPQATSTTTVSTTTSTSTTPSTTTSTKSTTQTTTVTTRAARITKKPHLQSPSRPLILFNNKAPSAAPKASRTPLSRWSSSGSSESQEGPGIMLMSEEEHFYRKPNNVHPSFLGPLPRNIVTEVKITTTTQPIVNRLRMTSAEEFPRRAPARRTFENNKFVDEWEITTTEQPSTPLFWVIPDPHEKRRRERLELLRKQGKQTPKFSTTTSRPSMDIKFALPSINDRAAAFTLTNGAKITDYLWIGLYDQCEHKSVPLISLKNIDPPREERISKC